MFSRLPVAALALVAALLISGCATEQQTGNPRFGISPGADILWIPEDEMNRELDLYKSMGFGWLRLDIDWHSIEPAVGEFNWEPTDRVVEAARKRGLRVLAMPAYTPAWAASVPGDPHSEPADMGTYAQFVALAVQRYEPLGVHDWEIWNEPNSSLFWKPRPNVTQYAEMLREAAEAIRENDSSATVVAGALAPAYNAKNKSQIKPVTFVEQLYAAGAAPYFDVLSVHPYTYPNTPTSTESTWRTSFDLTQIHKTMDALGDAKPIWITEFGAPTGADPLAVSEESQAEILVGALRDAPVGIERVFLYGGRDRGSDPANREQNFGFVRTDFTDKLSRGALQDVLRSPRVASSTPP